MYNDIFPCTFEPKIPADHRSVYQLLSTMRICKKDNILKFLVTEKTHATLKPKKRFPMHVDHIQFLTPMAGWKVTKVYLHFAFKQDPFKKE